MNWWRSRRRPETPEPACRRPIASTDGSGPAPVKPAGGVFPPNKPSLILTLRLRTVTCTVIGSGMTDRGRSGTTHRLGLSPTYRHHRFVGAGPQGCCTSQQRRLRTPHLGPLSVESPSSRPAPPASLDVEGLFRAPARPLASSGDGSPCGEPAGVDPHGCWHRPGHGRLGTEAPRQRGRAPPPDGNTGDRQTGAGSPQNGRTFVQSESPAARPATRSTTRGASGTGTSTLPRRQHRKPPRHPKPRARCERGTQAPGHHYGPRSGHRGPARCPWSETHPLAVPIRNRPPFTPFPTMHRFPEYAQSTNDFGESVTECNPYHPVADNSILRRSGKGRTLAKCMEGRTWEGTQSLRWRNSNGRGLGPSSLRPGWPLGSVPTRCRLKRDPAGVDHGIGVGQ